jgi:hypothetical protein
MLCKFRVICAHFSKICISAYMYINGNLSFMNRYC